jgi:hypothetical protein
MTKGIAMNRSIRNGMTVAAALALLVSAEEVTSANTVNNTLNEGGIKTAYNAQVAVGVASDHLLAVWTAKDAAGTLRSWGNRSAQ